jgi:YD repeat-containing protein
VLLARIGAAVPLARRFGYDEENRLVRMRSISAPLLTLKYDPLGRRTRHMMAGLETIAEYLSPQCTTGGGASLLSLEGRLRPHGGPRAEADK